MYFIHALFITRTGTGFSVWYDHTLTYCYTYVCNFKFYTRDIIYTVPCIITILIHRLYNYNYLEIKEIHVQCIWGYIPSEITLKIERYTAEFA